MLSNFIDASGKAIDAFMSTYEHKVIKLSPSTYHIYKGEELIFTFRTDKCVVTQLTELIKMLD